MQSRVKQIETRIAREIEEKEGLLLDLERISSLKIMPLAHHKETLVHIKDYSVKYKGNKEPVFANIAFDIKKGSRIALHGENGCGKSTLIKMVLQKSGFTNTNMPVTESGISETASGLVVSYVSQDTSMLKGNIQEFCIKQNLDKSLFFSILRQLGMERTQFVKEIGDYSEGQKKKLLLAASLLMPAHLYIWDEPLNYIDVFSRMQIENLISEYKPTMLFVEHDKVFREKIATTIIKL
ncbi:MAG TPA: ABC transporter ATP-binding protein [Lachnospiraceae bacterium]|nr:ABC transporter ATP-binding protein [Lachnospiraceae bacterium]